MRICIVGAGAIGGLLGAKLILAGEEVTLIDVGPHLAAIQQNGLKLLTADGEEQIARPVRATAKVSEAGRQDLIILAVKAHVTPEIAPALQVMMNPDTVVMPIQNGIPWWYFQRHGGEYEGLCLKTVDPGGIITRSIEPQRVIGCIPYPASEVPAPGVVRQVEGRRFPVGELDGTKTDRAERMPKP